MYHKVTGRQNARPYPFWDILRVRMGYLMCPPLILQHNKPGFIFGDTVYGIFQLVEIGPG
jgi:hypothetical protein